MPPELYGTFCPRPERRYQLLKYSLMRPGIERSPVLLFGLEPCRCVLSGGQVHYEHAPTIDFQFEFANHSSEAFLSNVARFDERIREVQSRAQRVDILGASRGDRIEFMKRLFEDVYEFIFLAQYSDELHAMAASKIVNRLPPADRIVVQRQILSSSFTRAAIMSGIYPASDKSMVFNPPPVNVWAGQIEGMEPREFIKDLSVNDFSTAEAHVLHVAHLSYQVAEAFGFMSNIATVLGSRVFAQIGQEMCAAGALRSPIDVFETRVEDLAKWSGAT